MVVTVGFYNYGLVDWVLRHILKQLLLETKGYGWMKAQNKKHQNFYHI
jgi:hypothetical protein